VELGVETKMAPNMLRVSHLVLFTISLASNGHASPMQFKSKMDGMRKTDRNAKDIGRNLRDDYADYYYYDYYYDEEPLPSGPTRRPNTSEEPEYDYYQEEQPLPSGPTRELPLPSGPTRRPGQAQSFAPKLRKNISPALNQFLSLPFLTTQRPRKLKPTKRIPRKKLLEQLGPFKEHFIAPPKVNAGALPLAFESSLPLNRFPPFNNPGPANKGDTDMRR